MVMAWAGFFQECSCTVSTSQCRGVVLEADSRVRCVLVLPKAKRLSYCSRETGGRAGLDFIFLNGGSNGDVG
jgi:hypothetical protein